MHIEQRFRFDRHAEAVQHQARQGGLVLPALLGEARPQPGVLDVLLEVRQAPFRGVQQVGAEGLHQQLGQPRVGLEQPAAERHAVGLVADALRIEAMEVMEHGFAHQLGVQCRYPVDLVRTEERQVAHAHPSAVALLDQADRTQQVEVVDVLGTQRVYMEGIDQVDDLHVARQQALHQRHRPGFQGFREQRVVGVGQGRHAQRPGVRPGQLVHVHQLPHQLGDGDRRVGVVELDRHLFRQATQVVMMAQVAVEQVLQRG
ncbi:Uncharacterised protein [Klebsiella pneumoniae]|nr:Uncharacterised protein [Klebsiella pneumoniae]